MGGFLLGEYEAPLSNWKPLDTDRLEYHIGRPYRLGSGPTPTPPGGYPIHRIRRQLDDARIG